MTEQEIKTYIEKLNSGNLGETIFLRQISKTVEVAMVWEQEPEVNDNISIGSPSYRFFFIKNDEGKYVGAVLDMARDLHWYILEEERKKGFLTTALREAILPYLFYDEDDEREIQRITIESGIGKNNYLNSRKVADRLGFKLLNESESVFELKKEEFDWQFESLKERNGQISEERFIELRKRIIFSFRQLIKISDELLMTYGDDKDLRDIAKEVSYFNVRIEDIECKYENK